MKQVIALVDRYENRLHRIHTSKVTKCIFLCSDVFVFEYIERTNLVFCH